MNSDIKVEHMNCHQCGSPMHEKRSGKGEVFLVCTKWPACKSALTPDLAECLERKHTRPVRGPVKIGDVANPLARLRILQSQMKQAKTDEERDVIREQYHSVMNAT